MKNVYVRFERGQEDKIGDVLGPFEYVQITYGSIRISPDDKWLAFLNKDDYWCLVSKPEELWSDVVIFCSEEEDKDAI